MKKNLLTLGVLLSVNLILLSPAGPVNPSGPLATDKGAVVVADGAPGPILPPPPPPPHITTRPTEWKSALA